MSVRLQKVLSTAFFLAFFFLASDCVFAACLAPACLFLTTFLAPCCSFLTVSGSQRGPFLLLPLPLPLPFRHLGSSCLFAALYAHALIALILLFSLCIQARLGTPTLNELGREPAEDCIGLVPWQQLRTSLRTDDYEKITEVNLRVWHGFVCVVARRTGCTDASAATPSADFQAVRQRPGTRHVGGTRERTSSTFPSVRGTATAVARTTLRGDGPAPRGERSLWSLERLQQRRNPRNDWFHNGRTLPRPFRNDAVFKLRRRWNQGRMPIRATTETRATPKRLPTSSRIWTPSFHSFSLAPGTRAWPPWWRRSRSATSSRYSCRTTSPFISAYAWPRKPGRRPARLPRVPSGKRHRGAASPQARFSSTTTMSNCWS